MPVSVKPEEVIERMRRGERLRWVPRRMAGLPRLKKETPGQRALLLASDELDDESGIDVIRLQHAGKLREHENGTCLDYEIVE